MAFVLQSSEVPDREAAGGKAFALARLRDVVDEVPAWFVVKPDAFVASLDASARERFVRGDLDPYTLDSIELAPSLREEVERAVARICPDGEPVAVRSSAVEEDSEHASFAGQLESYLGVAHADVPRRIVEVWRSGFSPRVREYRREKALAGAPKAPAVLVQRMVPAEVSGVAFSSDPVSGDLGTCVVSATAGLGDRLVAGEVEGEVYRVTRDGAVVMPTRGSGPPILDEVRVRRVARLARRAASVFDGPQDIEWAFSGGVLHLLQSRPITTLARARDDLGRRTIWDNSNIVESYGGVTSPLTFSFARHVYEAVYRRFFATLGVPAAVLGQHANALRNMLGYVQGRVYYNLLNWYRVLAMLPGFDTNRRFLDQMLGVRDSLSRADAELVSSAVADRPTTLRAFGRLVRSATSIGWNWLNLRRKIRSFHRRLDTTLAPRLQRVEEMRLDELADHYRDLERELLVHWEAPVLNDFFCMIAFGLSRHWSRKWLRDGPDALHGEFMRERGGIVSTEPARRIREMAELAARDRELREALVSGEPDRARGAMRANSAFEDQLDDYMDRFGDRCVQELKLESPTLYDDPTALLSAIGHLATRESVEPAGPAARAHRAELRRQLRGHPLRYVALLWMLRQASRRVQDRENLRFERTRVFGRARRVFVEIGKRLTDLGAIDDARDVFFLELQELLGVIEGTATTADLRGLVAIRKADSMRYQVAPDPPSRFETRGAVIGATPRAVSHGVAAAEADVGDTRQGLGCSPGTARGRARVIDDPRGQTLEPGEILVARQTDPGWVLLFTSAAGLVVERGSLLSHSAIVARELGIPAAVSVPGVVDWLRDGDLIEVDGSRGTVTRVRRE